MSWRGRALEANFVPNPLAHYAVNPHFSQPRVAGRDGGGCWQSGRFARKWKTCGRRHLRAASRRGAFRAAGRPVDTAAGGSDARRARSFSATALASPRFSSLFSRREQARPPAAEAAIDEVSDFLAGVDWTRTAVESAEAEVELAIVQPRHLGRNVFGG